MNIELRRLSPEDGMDVYEMLQAIPAEENGFTNSAHGLSFEEYGRWLEKADAESRMTGLMDGWRVPQTTYWLYDGGVPVGTGMIRHFLTDALRKRGGHIGYAVAPGYRGRGYGKELLRLLLIEAGRRGIDRALITVAPENAPSRAVARANGGIEEPASEGRVRVWLDTAR